MRILLLLAAIAAVSQAQTDCSRGACYPPSSDLLLGRAQQLHASSTCGLTGSEVYCTPYEQRRMKCCPCDSRNPYGQLAHTVQDVLSTSGPDRWWQSVKEVNYVTLQLDLGSLFQLDNLVLDFKIQFDPLRQYAYVPASKNQKIEDVSAVTGLRVRLMELGNVPRMPGRALSRFYALKEMRVMGRCMCHGHANRCLPEADNNLLTNSIQRCRFDQSVFEASGRRSGGVCEGCLHHTTGPKCDQCAPGYQPNPRSRMDRPDACIRCICSAEGTVNGGRCDDITGACQCKVNVEGPRCERCKRGYYDLSASNPLGCSKCSCSPDGSLSDDCDVISGRCACRPHFHGRTCEETGQCECRPGFGGPTCSECPDNTYGDPLTGCRLCRCDAEGTLPGGCDKQTGACLCRPGVRGTRCDSCSRGHCDSFPGCETCPSCFFTMDAQRQNLSAALERLSPRFPSRPGGAGDPGNFVPRILILENSLNLIRDSISLPPGITTQVDDALLQLDKLRNQMDRVNSDLTPLTPTPGLDSELDRLQALLDSLTLVYKAKKDAKDNSSNQNNAGAFSAIKTAYDESTDAAKKVNATGDVVKESADARGETMDLQNQVQPANTRDLDKLNQSMASRPDLTPVAKQVCGSVRSEPCTPLQCEGGALCPPDGTPPCAKGEKCVGALPLSKRADADAKDVKERLDKLTGKITEATEKVRESAEKLSNRMKQAQDDLEVDLKETHPSSNLTHIQEVSDWILKAKLPLSLAALKRKLEDLKNLAANLPDSTAVLNQAEPQLDKARKLLQEALDARDTALGVKADVDGLLEGFSSVKEQLIPAEKALDDASALINPMKPQLDELNKLLQNGSQQAQDAQDNADKAEDEAAAADEDLLSLEKQLKLLKEKAVVSEGAGPLGDRLVKLQQDAGALANTTDNMMEALEGKADSIKGLQDEILVKSKLLEGLDAKLKDILGKLRKKAQDLSTCQG
ncbi:hypothetical protein FQN60_009807 [Etheostoma spectabile]|uniref:Laminin EGF-like domain-containing protein n=1 Tax=Etheostoma spectabile TaxID=54343 RepID=A0A5J5DK82_9PERO|nr:hypothetical protein FQN60_009807 [Etheostoma spectabile]